MASHCWHDAGPAMSLGNKTGGKSGAYICQGEKWSYDGDLVPMSLGTHRNSIEFPSNFDRSVGYRKHFDTSVIPPPSKFDASIYDHVHHLYTTWTQTQIPTSKDESATSCRSWPRLASRRRSSHLHCPVGVAGSTKASGTQDPNTEIWNVSPYV